MSSSRPSSFGIPARGQGRAECGRQHRTRGTGRSAAIAPRMVWNSVCGTATSAIWKITEWPCRTILAPIFTNRCHSVVSDHCLTSEGSARVGRRSRPELHAWSRASEVYSHHMSNDTT
jgi:hypothetical protein